MPKSQANTYWKGLDQGAGAAEAAAAGAADDRAGAGAAPFTRRRFLEASGFALFVSAVAGCTRSPDKKALAPAMQGEGQTPGLSRYFATVCGACPAGCGALVKCRDGRPIKLEGNPEHPLSHGGLCAVGQASILELYDSQRLRSPLIDGRPAAWSDADAQIAARLQEIRQRDGAVRVLSDSLLGPTRRAVAEEFLESFRDARLVVYDPLSVSTVAAAHQRTHGARVVPRYRLDRAEVIVGLDADFLGTWISPVEFTAGYAAGRAPRGEGPSMSYHVQFEPRMSLTGAKADLRVPVRPEEIGPVLALLAARLERLAGQAVESDKPSGDPPVPPALLDELATRLWASRGKSLVLCGSQDLDAQVLCNLVNHLLDAYGNTLDAANPSHQRQGDDGQLETLLEEIHAGKVSALFVAGVDPVCDLPGSERLAEALKEIPLLVSLSPYLDETASLARFVCPEGHWLEQWSDAEPAAGVAGVAQPAIRPLGDTRSAVESLAVWRGQARTAQQLVQDHWEKSIFPRRASKTDEPFRAFWQRTVRDGFAALAPPSAQLTAFESGRVRPSPAAKDTTVEGPFTLVLYPKVAMLDGRHAQNPWLQELPDPVTKVAWDNYACLSPAAAERLGVHDGDVVRIAASEAQPQEVAIELPAVVQPGQHDAVVAVALGYGRKASARFAAIGPRWLEGRAGVGPNGLVGVNAAPLLRLVAGSLRCDRPGVIVTATGRSEALAQTQRHHEIAVPERLATPGARRRPVVEETTLADYVRDRRSGSHAAHHELTSLWPDEHASAGHRWVMAIDLGRCTGCSACVVACQAENNIPVVGRDEVRRSREMHWLRIDRYYSGQPASPEVVFQPMLCQQCGHAPCETVCPVLATVHGEEGLNQQVYNRCVGTRYCANNCPYKVRRFNWFAYARPDARENLVVNPDVTVRSRGVMEKCSFCVQRIQEAKIEARRQGRPVADGDARPACQQSCPAGAIVFGDLNDPKSAVSGLAADPRAFQVLAELGVRPSVHYLRLVRNRAPEEGPSHHV